MYPVSETKKYQTFGVLAGAYLGKSPKLDNCLTHVCEVDSDGPVRVLCSRVKFEHICPDGFTNEQLAAPATCRTCARRDPRF